MNYTLTAAELARIKELAEKKKFCQNVRWGENHEQNVVNGLAAELAFCRLFNTPFNWAVNVFGDPGDAIVNGQIVDVKQTSLETGGLVVCPYKINGPAELYALMVGVAPGPFTFKGFAPRAEVFKPENIVNLGYGERFYLPAEELKNEV